MFHRKKEQRIPVGRKIFTGKLTNQNMVRRERELNISPMGSGLNGIRQCAEILQVWPMLNHKGKKISK